VITRTSEVEFEHSFSTHSMMNLQRPTILIYIAMVYPKRSKFQKIQILNTTLDLEKLIR